MVNSPTGLPTEHVPRCRESWLRECAQELVSDFLRIGLRLELDAIRISCGFPSRNALGRTRRVVGQCFPPRVSETGLTEIFINPTESDSLRVADILIHAVIGVECGHRGAFRQAALSIGLEGPMTATIAGESLKKRLNDLIDQLGPYPHGALFPAENPISRSLPGSHLPKKQTTRMIKLQCQNCGYVVRTSRRWIEVGLPVCHCGDRFAIS